MALLATVIGAPPLGGQVPAAPTLEGVAYVGDTVMKRGTVVLHRISSSTQGELDSLAIGDDGAFVFELPGVPDPERNDVFFASIRHQGVLYFGPALTSALQLDSIYRIQAYDTLMAPVGGMDVTLQSRSVFFEPDSAAWRVTDLFQLRNDHDRTIVARAGGRTWSHPLPSEAYDVTAGEGELSFDAIRHEDGELIVRAALPPGERLFVARYRLDEPTVDIPTAGTTETMDVLVREPAPPLGVEGLELLDRIELEAGSTYLRYSGTDVAAPRVRITEAEDDAPPRVEWAAVILALLLTAAAVFVLRPSTRPKAVPAAPASRDALIREVALLDQEFEGEDPSEVARLAYERRRAELIRRIRALD
ncbi:MAG: hypothetical protein R3304_11555 [Longimicrobiales bacterium]|nr:hypothetical protein [Longimicrobiales bacterium]